VPDGRTLSQVRRRFDPVRTGGSPRTIAPLGAEEHPGVQNHHRTPAGRRLTRSRWVCLSHHPWPHLLSLPEPLFRGPPPLRITPRPPAMFRSHDGSRESPGPVLDGAWGGRLEEETGVRDQDRSLVSAPSRPGELWLAICAKGPRDRPDLSDFPGRSLGFMCTPRAPDMRMFAPWSMTRKREGRSPPVARMNLSLKASGTSQGN